MITSKIIANGIVRAVAIITLLGLGLFFLYLISDVIIYILVALVLTLILKPIVKFFEIRLKFRPILAIVTTFVLMISMILLFFLLFVPLIHSQSKSLSLLDIQQIELKIELLVANFKDLLEKNGVPLGQFVNNFEAPSLVNFSFVSSFFNNILSFISNLSIGIASVIFMSFFFLKDTKRFTLAIKLLIPDKYEAEILNSISKTNTLLSRYFIGLLLQLFLIFILYLIVLFIFQVPNPIIIALLCAILNIIPYIGPLISTVLAAILTMIAHIGEDFQTDILPTTIYVLIGFFIVQFIDNNINQPLIFSKSTNSHPIEIFLVILIAGFISGILGMVIAVPIYTILKVIAKEFLSKRRFFRFLTYKM
ncbi:AI-2E family transporter [Flavobacterium sp.]|jgi:predicted PurR-regulated permease PerM|uniref:AI-2E family transporter n=1 Tax=Flavobacterium sp. TaxID=239 RepID=UPI0037C025F0